MSTEERTDFRKCGPDVLYETRKIVIKMWKSKVPVEEIGRITGLTTKTIYDKIRLYKEGGMTALKPKTRGRKSGEKRTLKPTQEKEIIKIITDKNPDQLKFKCCLWTREVLKQLIREKYGIDMPIRTVGQYLQRWGVTVQRPAKQAMNQKPEAVQTWLHEQYPSIHEEAKKAGAEIFWGDETAVQNVANYARGYAPISQTPVLKVHATKMHINMLSAISSHGKVYFTFSKESINQDKLIDFFERLIKDIKHPIFMILDNLRAHHSKKVTAWVESHQAKFRLFFLPAYSPEYNPDEYLNHDLKRTIGTQQQVRTESELQEQANVFMNSLSKAPEHVQSYFDHPALSVYEEIKQSGNI